MTKLKPILFSTPMISAILEGRKTQTRRVIKYNKKITDPKVGTSIFCDEGQFEVRGHHENGEYGASFFRVPIMKGEILWVRETWNKDCDEEGDYYRYKADDYDVDYKWKPSIHMPKEACRIFLKVAKVRIERLNEISGEDAVAEGVGGVFRSGARNMTSAQIDYKSWENKQVALFRSLWQSINGPGSWERNPFVWVYDFERVEKPEAWS